MKLKNYHYIFVDTGVILRITEKRKPSLNTKPRSGTWIVKVFEKDSNGFVMPCFPEITWGVLKNATFLGCTK
jgi:hypothetical protein